MNYSKGYLSVEEAVNRLEGQGLIFHNKQDAIAKLAYVNYYRLKQYWHPYRKSISEDKYEFEKGTIFEYIWNLYRFDRRLRQILFDGIERIEIGIRSRVVHIHSREFGAFGYLNLDGDTFPSMGKSIKKKKRCIPKGHYALDKHDLLC